MSNPKPPYGPKTTKRIEKALRAYERTGVPSSNGGVGDATIRGRERWGTASVDPEEGGSWEIAPEDRMFPFELGYLDSEREFVGSGTWIEAFAADGPVLENKVLLLKYMPGDSAANALGLWTCVTWSVGILHGLTVDALGAGATATVDVDGLGQVELENWSGQNVAAGKKCKVGWNSHEREWQIVSVDC